MNRTLLQACRPAFQPVMDLRTGRTVGCEALIRHPDLTPKALFAMAAAAGRLVEFDLFCALLALQNRPQAGLLFVNLCPATVMAVIERPEQYRLMRSCRSVVWELSEQPGWTVADEALPRLKAALGGRLALDDVGEGWSDLRRLREVEPLYVKIGASLVQGCADDPGRAVIIQNIVRMAKDLGARPIAEAVETAGDAKALLGLGCRYAQGYYFGKPVIREAGAGSVIWAPERLRIVP